MPLTKTTKVPPNDPAPILANSHAIKMVIIVNDPSLAEKADNLAHHPPITDRQVIWFQSGLPVDYKTRLSIPYIPNISTVAAFSLKLDNTLGDIIFITETKDYVRISLAYYKAGI